MNKIQVKLDLESKGWIVKEGILYGGDFILYKPSTKGHVHGEFLVKCYDTLPTYLEIMGSIRCCTSVKKVFAYIETNYCDIRFIILSYF